MSKTALGVFFAPDYPNLLQPCLRAPSHNPILPTLYSQCTVYSESENHEKATLVILGFKVPLPVHKIIKEQLLQSLQSSLPQKGYSPRNTGESQMDPAVLERPIKFCKRQEPKCLELPPDY